MGASIGEICFLLDLLKVYNDSNIIRGTLCTKFGKENEIGAYFLSFFQWNHFHSHWKAELVI